MSIQVIPLKVDREVAPGDRLEQVIADALELGSIPLLQGDVIVVAQKIVSKCESRVVRLSDVKVSARARRTAKRLSKDPAITELILQEASEVVAASRGIIITQTHHGFVCANSGVDQSNVGQGYAVLLPRDSDESAHKLRLALESRFGVNVAVIISDTFGRAFRMGQTNVAIGASGIEPIKSYIGSKDTFGNTLRVTEIAVADELAAAAELVMGKSIGVPAAIVRGYSHERSLARGSAKKLSRPKAEDLFR
ncbi:MAG: coenzyme F420-0:L-glutamate ligase [Nitrososphaera sp.]